MVASYLLFDEINNVFEYIEFSMEENYLDNILMGNSGRLWVTYYIENIFFICLITANRVIYI